MRGLRDKIHKVFKIAHLDKNLTFAEDEGEAFKLLGVHVQQQKKKQRSGILGLLDCRDWFLIWKEPPLLSPHNPVVQLSRRICFFFR